MPELVYKRVKPIAHIRICLAEDGTVAYWPMYEGEEDLGSEPLSPKDALYCITGAGVPFELACCDPLDKQPHNYELLTSNAEGATISTFKLTRI